MRINFFFNWRDLWIGVYIDNKKKIIYICPIPMFGIKIYYGKKYKENE